MKVLAKSGAQLILNGFMTAQHRERKWAQILSKTIDHDRSADAQQIEAMDLPTPKRNWRRRYCGFIITPGSSTWPRWSISP